MWVVLILAGDFMAQQSATMPRNWALAAIIVAFLVGRWTSNDGYPQPVSTSSPSAAVDIGPTPAPIASKAAAQPLPPASSTRRWRPAVLAEPQREKASSVYYANCSAARAAGAAPIHVGEPGYAPHLDRDRDGVACE